MSPPRRTSDLRRSLTFGGRVPPVIGLVLLLIVVVTVASWLLRNIGWAVLDLRAVRSAQVWRLLSWALVQPDPLTLVVGGLVLYMFGPQLAHDFGERRLLGRLLGLTLGAGLLSLAAAWLLEVHDFAYLGIWPVVDGLVLLWALRYPDRQLLFFLVLPVSGRTLALLTVGVTALYALWGIAGGGVAGLVRFAPAFAALLIAWLISGGRIGMPLRRLQFLLRDWWLEHKLRRRPRHLKVVKKNGRGGEPPTWLN
jgi:membrane associated rhomboid family serine protease